MPEEKDVKSEQSQDAKATEKSDSVAKAPDTSANNFPELSSLEEQVKSDASAPKAEEKAPEGEKPADSDSSEKPGEAAPDKVSTEAKEVDLDPELLKDLFGEEVTPEAKPVPIENKVAELERKNKELFEKLQTVQNPPAPPPLSDEQMDELFQKDYPNLSPQQCRDLYRFMQDFANVNIRPEISKVVESATQKNQYKEAIKAHKYYKLVASDIDEIVKSDEIAQSLPEQKKWKYALNEAIQRKLPVILKNHASKARKAAEENRTLIPKDHSATSESKPKSNVPELTAWDKKYLAHRKGKLTEADLVNPNFQGKTVIED